MVAVIIAPFVRIIPITMREPDIYLLCEFGSPWKFTHNRVEHNSSYQDGLKNGYGAITISGAGNQYPINHSAISHNIIEVSENPLNGPRPNALYLLDANLNGILIIKNKFTVLSDCNLMRCDTIFKMVRFIHNDYTVNVSHDPIQCSKCKEGNPSWWKSVLNFTL